MMRWGIIFLSVACLAGSPARDPVDEVESAILHIVIDGIERFNIEPFVGNKMARNPTARRRLSKAIVVASTEYPAIPRMLLVGIAFRENSFGGKNVGKIGEKSEFQVVPKVAGFIRKGAFPWSNVREPRCRLDTVEGAALCAAALLSINATRCDSVRGAMVLYASGRTCKPDTPKLRWIQRDRFGIAEYLEELF